MEHAYTPNLVLTPYMGLTEKEMNIMAPLVYQVEKCRLSCKQLEKMLTSLETQKNEQLAQVNKWFEHAHLVLNQSHAFSTGEIKVKCTEVHALLAQHLETTRQTQLTSQTVMFSRGILAVVVALFALQMKTKRHHAL